MIQQANVVRPLRVLGRDLCARLNHKLQTSPEILHPFLRATAECFARLSHRLGVCLSVTLVICIKTVQARITKSSLWVAPRSLVYHDKISCHWVQWFPSNEGVKERYPLRICHLPLLARIMWKRLQTGTYMLLIITSTGDRLFGFININDLERPWTPQKEVFSKFFAIFRCSAHFNAELRQNGWR